MTDLLDINSVSALLNRAPKTTDRLIRQGVVPPPMYDPRTKKRYWHRTEIEALARDLAPRRSEAAELVGAR